MDTIMNSSNIHHSDDNDDDDNNNNNIHLSCHKVITSEVAIIKYAV